MSFNQRFQYKLWNLVNSNKSSSIQWNKTGDAILFNFVQFKKEILDCDADFCKSNKLTSFIRQLNLYGFKKTSDIKRKKESHEFRNSFFLRGREDLLQYVKRNSISPRTKKRGRSARRKTAKMKKMYHIQDHPKEIRKQRRGRPKKMDQVKKINTKENNHNHEKKNVHCGITERSHSFSSPRKEDSVGILKEAKFFSGRDIQRWKNMFNFKNSNIMPSKSKNEELQQIKNSVDGGSESKYCITLQSPQIENSDPFKNISKRKEDKVSVFSDITNVASRITSIPKSVTQNKIPNISELWHKEKRSQSLLINNSLKQVHSSNIHPKIHKWEMQALVDENQHVLLKICEPFPKDCKSEMSNNPSQKICYLQWKPQDRKIKIEDNFLDEKKMQHTTKKCFCSSSMKTEESELYKSKYLYETDCEITDEYLELREAYFRHYSERRPKNCDCSKPCII
ncbi:hypothetical protein AVEN_73841-1 [Araneus ventricosus]|uniref:HSF-type DNA-binding domain-containing protein n=1 Tax=Araneus ventricosus TaxID=182803 RepID=A0A4Y2GDF3_ARAVE|nr:hypothetical protein AVEN_73841-1 [Araneus ventricosus]